jgi:hypothetical protein
MRSFTFLSCFVIALLLCSNAAHADEPTHAPDTAARYRLELGGGLVHEGGGRPDLGSARLGLGYDFSAHLGVVFDARHLFVETRNPRPMDGAWDSYDDFGLGLRFRAPLGRQVELFLTPLLLASRFGYEHAAYWGKGAALRAGVEVGLGGPLWVGASAGGTLSWASEESVETHGSAEAYVTLRF